MAVHDIIPGCCKFQGHLFFLLPGTLVKTSKRPAEEIFKGVRVTIPIGTLAGAAVMYVGRNNEFIKFILADALEFPSFVKLMRNTFSTFSGHYITGIVGLYSWFEFSAPLILIVVYFCILTYINSHLIEDVKGYFNIGRRLWMLLMAALAMLFVFVAMQSWTLQMQESDLTQGLDTYRIYIRDMYQVIGVQGRYFIPVIPVAAVALSGTSRVKHKKYYYPVLYGYYAWVFLSVAYNVYIRFWV